MVYQQQKNNDFSESLDVSLDDMWLHIGNKKQKKHWSKLVYLLKIHALSKS